jgi:hypothetical protein
VLKKIAVGALALAAAGFTSSAMAACPVGTFNTDPHQINAQQYCVDVNIQVDPEVSLWADNGTINLVMNGADGNNTAFAYSGVNVINNIAAQVDVLVAGSLPAPLTSGGGIYFHIFDNHVANPSATFLLNGYGNANARTWTNGTLNTSQRLFDNIPVNTSPDNLPITYAATSPGELPLPATYNLTVTYTIADNTL